MWVMIYDNVLMCVVLAFLWFVAGIVGERLMLKIYYKELRNEGVDMERALRIIEKQSKGPTMAFLGGFLPLILVFASRVRRKYD